MEFFGPYFPAFRLNMERYEVKYGPEKTPYLDTFHVVQPLEDTGFGYEKSSNIITNRERWKY